MSLLEKPIENLSRGLFLSVTKLAKDVRPRYVHRLRTTIRRVETLIESSALSKELSKKQKASLEKLSALRRRAGRVRDFDVQLDLLGAIANGSTATDKSAVAELLQRKREKNAGRLQSAVEKFKASRHPANIKSVFQKAREAASSAGTGDALQRAQKQLADLSDEFADQSVLKSGVLHDLRIQLKAIRYLAELGEGSEEQQNFLGEMRTVQDALGTWHDWEQLAKTAEKQFGDRANCPLLLEIRALFAAQHSTARSSVAQLFARNVRKHPGPVPIRALARRA